MRRLFQACAVALALSGVACGGGATAEVKSAPKLKPADPVAVKKMITGVERARDGKTKEAIDLLEEAVGKDPQLWEAHFNLGVLRAQTGDLEKAEEALEKAAQLAPNAEDVAVALGEVRRRLGEADRAVEGLEAFVKAHRADRRVSRRGTHRQGDRQRA